MAISPMSGGLEAQLASSVSKIEINLSRAIKRLSTGLRVNSAKDDPAGMSVAASMKNQIASLKQAVRNANDGLSLLQTIEGGVNRVSGNLVRLKELATQASNSTVTSAQRADGNQEYQALLSDITMNASTTQFNGTSYLNQTTGALTLQVGAFAGTTYQVSNNLASFNVTLASLSINGGDITTVANAQTAMTALDTAQSSVSSILAITGALQARLSSTVENLNTMITNLTESYNNIVAADVAEETANVMQNQTLANAAAAMAAQVGDFRSLALSYLRNISR